MTASFGIDVGGSGIKGAKVEVETGELLTERFRIPTPRPALADPMMDVAAEIVAKGKWDGPVGCAFPAVVHHGVVHTAANIDESWIGRNGPALLSRRTGHPSLFLNDADAAGIAEMRFGAGVGEGGVVLMLTFGTGIGSALFVEGRLHPNTELGHLELDGHDAEDRAAARLREDGELGWAEWIARVQRYLAHVESLLWPDLIIFGGGISKKHKRILPGLDIRTRIVPAVLRNNAGIVGAALAAHEELS